MRAKNGPGRIKPIDFIDEHSVVLDQEVKNQ
jgi:hypothetical protein